MTSSEARGRKVRDRGRKAHNHGAAWEKEIDTNLDEAIQQGLITDWRKQEPPTKVVGKGGRKRIINLSTGLPDYLVWNDNWAWMLEAKHTDNPDPSRPEKNRMPWAQVERHQAEDLTSWLGPGRNSGVLFRYVDEPILIPWTEAGPLWWGWEHGEAGRGEASLTLEDAREIGHVGWAKIVLVLNGGF